MRQDADSDERCADRLRLVLGVPSGIVNRLALGGADALQSADVWGVEFAERHSNELSLVDLRVVLARLGDHQCEEAALGVEVGAAGELLVERSHDGARRLVDFEDLTGDGLTEVGDLTVTEWDAPGDRTALRVVDDQPLWTWLAEPWFAYPQPAGDHSGDGAQELLHRDLVDDTFVVDSLRGADLERRWRWTHPLPR